MNVIAAHTLQRSRMLETIAKDGHVYGITRNFQDFLKGKRVVPWGVKKASVRPFLCGTHDDALFSSMEKAGFRVCREHCFLLGYRAILNGIYLTRATGDVATLMRQLASQATGLHQKALLVKAAWRRECANFHHQQLEREKKQFDQALLSNDLSRFHIYVIEFQERPDILSSHPFFPVRDFDGNQLQSMTIASGALQVLTFSLVPAGGSGAAVFVWSSDSDDASRKFVESLQRMAPEQIPHAIVRMCYTLCENSFYAPSWWEALSDEERKVLHGRFDAAARIDGIPPADHLADDGLRLVNWTVTAQRWL